MSMFEDIPVDVGVIYEGERVRRPQLYVEFGGTKCPYKFELVRARKMEEIEDGKVTIIGPDIKDFPEGARYQPLGILVEVAGKEVEEELEGVIERRIHEFTNYIEGLMHLNQRYDIWIRLSKKSFKKGFNSFVYWGKVLCRLFKSEMPFIQKVQVTFITDPEKVKEMYQEALKVYEARDARARGLKDEDVDVFYGCALCQSFAPTHVSIITPQRYANCGAISWFDARAAAKVDPKGPIFAIPKGECLDPVKGEYTGVNEAIKKRTLGAIDRVWLYTAFGYPHTSCGCFEAALFYIPEVDGFGVVHRGFTGKTVTGLTFGAIADATAGGRQVDGFHGISIEYMRSPKFIQADGGWYRVVWAPKELLEKVKDFIPQELIGKIATEEDVSNVEELKQFLKERGHPIVERWAKEKPPEEVEEKVVEEVPEAVPELVATAPSGVPSGMGVTLRLKNVKIYAKKLVIRRAGARSKG